MSRHKHLYKSLIQKLAIEALRSAKPVYSSKKKELTSHDIYAYVRINKKNKVISPSLGSVVSLLTALHKEGIVNLEQRKQVSFWSLKSESVKHE